MSTPKVYFPKVKEAREALKEKALELYEQYDKVIKLAIASEQLDVALEAMQFLMKHMPAQDGAGMLDISIDKPKQVESKSGPQINIGFALGGIDDQKALPPTTVVDVVDVEEEK